MKLTYLREYVNIKDDATKQMNKVFRNAVAYIKQHDTMRAIKELVVKDHYGFNDVRAYLFRDAGIECKTITNISIYMDIVVDNEEWIVQIRIEPHNGNEEEEKRLKARIKEAKWTKSNAEYQTYGSIIHSRFQIVSGLDPEDLGRGFLDAANSVNSFLGYRKGRRQKAVSTK